MIRWFLDRVALLASGVITAGALAWIAYHPAVIGVLDAVVAAFAVTSRRRAAGDA